MYWRMTELGPLTRRYIVIGAFDGALTVVAIVLAAFASSFVRPADVHHLIIAGLGAAVGLAISSGWGAFEAERSERRRELEHLSRMMQRDLNKCMVDSAVRFATYWASLIHALSPLPAALLPLVPIVLLPTAFHLAAIISILITLVFLFVLGLYMGRIAGTNCIVSGLRMVLAALITAAICALIGAH